jgi:hypothetical protein
MRVTWTCFDVSGLILTNIYSMSLRSFKDLLLTDWLRVERYFECTTVQIYSRAVIREEI